MRFEHHPPEASTVPTGGPGAAPMPVSEAGVPCSTFLQEDGTSEGMKAMAFMPV